KRLKRCPIFTYPLLKKTTCYVNYCDRELKNWQTAYYGNNWQKLKQVKQQFDPGNFFRFEQSVTPQT
ncbi:MAG: hypothetical protein C4287_19160, partial [Leptolyngbya sp. ERB_1_2]